MTQAHAKPLQRIEIHMDVGDYVFGALDMLGRNNIMRKSCRLVLENVNMLGFSYMRGELVNVVRNLEGFETVVVVQKFKYVFDSAFDDRSFRSCMALSLGLSRVYDEGSALCHEFHPREYVANK